MNRRSCAVLSILALSISMAQACIIEAIEGNGVQASQVREYAEFDQVSVAGGAFDTVDIYVCECDRVRVSGDENLLGYIDTEVDGEVLEVDTSGYLMPELPLVVEIYTSSLERVDVSGSSNIRVIDLSGGALTVSTSGSSDVKLKGALEHLSIQTSGSSDVDIVELEAGTLEVDTSGSSDLDLYGEVDRLEVHTSGSSDVRARELVARDVSIQTSGSSDVEVCVTGHLDVSVSGSGDVDYFCEPESVSAHVSGSGEVKGR